MSRVLNQQQIKLGDIHHDKLTLQTVRQPTHIGLDCGQESEDKPMDGHRVDPAQRDTVEDTESQQDE